MKLFVFDVALFVETNYSNAWSIDFSPSIHMSFNRNWLDTYYENINDAYIYLRNNRAHEIKGCRDIFVMFPNG